MNSTLLFLTVQYFRPLIGKLLAIPGTENTGTVNVRDLKDRYCAEERYILRVTLHRKGDPVIRACPPDLQPLLNFLIPFLVRTRKMKPELNHATGN